MHFCDLFRIYWIPNAMYWMRWMASLGVHNVSLCLCVCVSKMTAIKSPHIKIDLKFCYKLDWTRDFSISRCENVDDKIKETERTIMWCEGELNTKKKRLQTVEDCVCDWSLRKTHTRIMHSPFIAEQSNATYTLHTSWAQSKTEYNDHWGLSIWVFWINIKLSNENKHNTTTIEWCGFFRVCF